MRTLHHLCLLVVCAVALTATTFTLAAETTGSPNAQMQAVLEALQKLQPKPIETLPPVLARRQPSVADAMFQWTQEKGIVAPDRLPPVGKVEMRNLPGAQGSPIPVRVYTPKGSGPFPVMVYFHGGGWVIATVDTYDASCRGLCSLNRAVVVSVEYRKAPEHQFPAAPEDGYAALQYVTDHAAEFNGDMAKIAVAGESAGGNLAAVVCLMAKQRNGKMPVHQVLIYPITNYAFDTPSYHENANAKPLNAAMMRWFFQHYLRNASDGENILVSPLRATPDQLRGLPPATVITAEVDPLRSEGMAYADKLRAAGIDVASKDFEGVTHEFFGLALAVDQAKAAHALVTGRLKAAFGK